MTAECPFCEYTGPSREVEAHISGMSDEAHQGRVGSDWRGTIKNSHGEEQGVSATKAMLGVTAVLVLMTVIIIMADDPAREEDG